jgi:hypothetical protein
MLSKLFVRKSQTKHNKFLFVKALGLYQKQIIRYRNVSFLNEFRNENPFDLMRMLRNR